MTPADLLHQAAAVLRQHAEKVPPDMRAEPWTVAQTDSEYMDGVLIARDHQNDGEFDFAIETHRESLATYIATVHPGVGLLLADLLDRLGALVALEHQQVSTDAVEKAFRRELAVARAILSAGRPDAGRPA